MTIVKPAKNRHTVTDTNTTLQITIPGKSDWLSTSRYLLASFLIIAGYSRYLLGGITLITNLLSVAPLTVFYEVYGLWIIPLLLLFMVIYIGGPSILVFVLIYNIIWQVRGKEIIEIEKERVSIQHQVIWWERKNNYLVNEIKDLRVSYTPVIFHYRKVLTRFRNSKGLIAFDYGAKTYRFGRDIEEAEAKDILETITARFPQYKTP